MNKMIVSDEVNYNKLHSTIYKELKSYGIKHRIKKIVCKAAQHQKNIFGAPLGSVPTCTVQCCGSQLQIPAIIPELCSVLRSNLHVEGLFRKAGSQVRQKDIRRVLDTGGLVCSTAHPVDVASVLKLYLRALPVALVPSEVQEVLVRCRLVAGPGHTQLLLHALLLLPQMHLHLLHYLMEFLNSVASKHMENRMDVMNLAIVMTPSVMPLPASAPTQRLDHHVALVKFMIENASLVGSLSEEMVWRLGSEGGEGGEVPTDERRKKRRSGSLTRMLSGLRKIVGGGERSGKTVLNTPDLLATPHLVAMRTPHTPRPLATPILTKSAVKRKMDTCTGLSTKSKNKVMKNLPQSSLSFTPLRPKGNKEQKKLRLSLVGRSRKSKSQSNEQLFSKKVQDASNIDGGVFPESEIDLSDAKESDYVRISKHEYEEIKSRVSAIESRLSQELDGFFPAKEPVHRVQTAYEKTLEEAAMLNSSSSEQLARRLSKELKIRQSAEHKIIRSPSARKIGTIRRRSKDNVVKLSRNKWWNVSTQSQSGANSTSQFYPIGLKRGRPNTVTTGLNQPNVANTLDSNKSESSKTVMACETSRHIVNENISSSSNVSSNSNHSYHTRNQVRQLPRKEPTNWISAASFLRSEERLRDPTTGRASVNQLRNQNAGMVLAKAKIFDQISDSDNSAEKKTVKGHNGNTGFARKPRINSNTAAQSQLALHTSSASSTPRLSKIKESVRQPRSPVSRRNRMRSVLSKENDSAMLDIKKTSESPSVASQKTQRSTPYIRKPLSVKSTRNLRTPMSEVRRQTPMRAVHATPPTPSNITPNLPQIRARKLM